MPIAGAAPMNTLPIPRPVLPRNPGQPNCPQSLSGFYTGTAGFLDRAAQPRAQGKGMEKHSAYGGILRLR